MFHDGLKRFRIHVKILPALGKDTLAIDGLPGGRDFQGGEIEDVIVPGGKLIRHGPQRCLYIAAGGDDINIMAECCPEVYRRDNDDDGAIGIVKGQKGMDSRKIHQVFIIAAHTKAVT